MSEAQQVMALHRRTESPVMECRDAIRAAPGDLDGQLAYLRDRVAAWMREHHPGATWDYPPGLRPR